MADDLDFAVSTPSPVNFELEADQKLDFDSGAYFESGTKIHVDTSEHWNSQKDLIGRKNELYVYTDYLESGSQKIGGIKVGDGEAYLIDTPFLAGNNTLLKNHINDKVSHITTDERKFWNNKVTCFLSKRENETVVFTKGKENG